jgi:signal recognition particle subunit SRP19
MTSTTSSEDHKAWQVIYPVYINSKKTVADGRRLAVSKCCVNPTITEIADVCKYLQLKAVIEVCEIL